jgi:hypothetical protein
VDSGVSTDARSALLAHLIDHAPTFPPAQLPPAAALEEDRRARSDRASWILGRLVWRAALFAELGGEEREVSVVLDGDAPDDPRVVAREILRPSRLDELADTGLETYVELPLDAALEDDLDAIAKHGLRAKVRCGGAAVPEVSELARFVRLCRTRGVAFKATAGLHHAVRSEAEHGLLNLLAAAVFCDEEQALADDDPDVFRLDAGAFRWRDHVAEPDRLAAVRNTLLHSVGSCSFFEPVEELRSLGFVE